MNERSVIRDRLWHSLEMTYLAFWVSIAALAVLIEALYVLLFASPPPFGPNRWLVFGLMAAFTAVPILGFCLWRTFSIFRCPKSYHFCKAKLSNPKSGRIRDTVRFLVVLEDADGCQFTAYTHSIFFTHRSSGGLSFEDYVNQKVTIGYNEETGQVAVIG